MAASSAGWPGHYAGPAGPLNGSKLLRAGAEAGSLSCGPKAVDPAAKNAASAKAAPADVGHASVLSVMLNLTRNIVGAGVLCLPFTLREGGAGLGLLALAATGALSLGGFLAIGQVCQATGAKTYREACCRTIGTAPLLVDVMILFECVITCVGYMILILDYLSKGLQGLMDFESPAARARLAAAVGGAFLTPLCLRPSLDSLKFSSLLGNVTMLYTIFYVITEYMAWEDRHGLFEEAVFVASDRMGVFRALCVMTSAYIAHYSAPAMLDELSAHPAPLRGFSAAAVASFGLAMLAYAAFSVAGYERFGSCVLGNVLLSYGGGLGVLLAWLSMAATLVVSFPIIFKPARDTIAEALSLQRPRATQPVGDRSCRPWVLMTVLAVAGTVGTGVLFTDISRVLAFRGALLGCPISFVLPGLMLLNCPDAAGGAAGERGLRAAARRLGAQLLVLFGTLAGCLGLFCTFAT